MLAMRCPKCGGIPTLALIDVEGRRLYRCTTGISRTDKHHGTGQLDPCDTIIDDHRKLVGLDTLGYPVKEVIVFRSGSLEGKLNLKSITVMGGKEL